MRQSKLSNLLTKEMLEYEYEQCGSMQKMADKLNVSVDSIYKYMKMFNIEYDPHFKRQYKCNDDIFKEETERAFYLAGFIAADGSLQNRKYSKILKVALSKKDIAHLEKIRYLLDSNNPIKEYTVKPSKLIQTTNQCVEIQIVSKNIFDDLAKFNVIPNKTKIYTFPKWLITHPMVNHYMRGYFDGDGCISKCGLSEGRIVEQGNFSILGTKSFIKNYKNALVKNAQLGDVKIVPHSTGGVYILSYSGNGNMSKIYDFLYKDATIYLDRKLDRINYFIA